MQLRFTLETFRCGDEDNIYSSGLTISRYKDGFICWDRKSVRGCQMLRTPERCFIRLDLIIL